MNQFIQSGYMVVLLLLWAAPFSFGQQRKPVKVQACYDSSSVPELFSRVQAGFIFIFPGHKKAATEGFPGGKIRWKKVQVQSPQGTFKNGMLHFDPQKVWNNGHKAELKVTFADTVFYCELALPYLESVHFNLYADSLKRDVPYYLNIEGHFSSGKTYPLDTQKIRFYTSAGQLHKNILLLPESDSLTSQIRIKGVFKWDKALADSCRIPVKTHLKNIALPTEKELLEQWKKERRRK